MLIPSGWANERPRERLLRFTYTSISMRFFPVEEGEVRTER